MKKFLILFVSVSVLVAGCAAPQNKQEKDSPPLTPSLFAQYKNSLRKTLKGQTRDQLFVEYLTLYTQWARENPHHLEELRYRAHAEYFSTLTDQFASDPEFSQAKALAILLNDTDRVYNYKIDLTKDEKFKKLIQKRHKESIEWATKLNKYLMKQGEVKVNKIIHYRKKGDKTHPLYTGFLNVDVII